jgi:glycosyltransferase involved in cell wall biosynthesis
VSPRDRFEILGVGRLVPKKGFDTLIHACRILAARGLSFRCRVFGDGPERERLERLAKSEGIEGAVTFAGSLSNEQIRAEMAGADVVALPARIADDGNRDALPTVLLEAMALGRPFVSTPVTGIPEIAGGGETGRLVSADRPEEFADALESLAADRALWNKLGQAGPRRAANLFDIRKNVSELHGHFRNSAASTANASRRSPGTRIAQEATA